MLRSIASGVVGGLIVAVFCLSLGALRALFALLSGRTMLPLTASDAAFVVGYAASFGAAGAVVGLCWPWIRFRAVRHLAFYVAGTVFIVALLNSQDKALLQDTHWAMWFMLGVLGVIIGLFGVYYFEHEYPQQAGVDQANVEKS